MSWYTYLYPDWDYSSYKTIDNLQKEIDTQNALTTDCWNTLCSIVISSPNILFPNEPLKLTIDLFNNAWYTFISNATKLEKLSYLRQFWQSQIDHDDYIKKYPDGSGFKYSQELGREMTDEEYKEYIEKERAKWKPYVYCNHFEYSDRPEIGVEETEELLDRVKLELLMLCTYDKSAYKCEEYDNPFDTIVSKMISTKEWVDSLINDRYFSQLCVKYWDTREIE